MNRVERKIVRIFLLTGLLPLAVTVYLARQVIEESFSIGVNEPVAERLERSLRIQQRLFESWNDEMALAVEALAGSVDVAAAVAARDDAALSRLLRERIRRSAERAKGTEPHGPTLVSLVVQDAGGRPIAAAEGTAAGGRTRHREERRPLAGGGAVVATFAIQDAIFEEYQRAGELTETFDTLGEIRDRLQWTYSLIFLGLLTVVLLLSFALGLALARRVTRRIAVLHKATEAVGQGDLTVRVPSGPEDEVGELSTAFNRMVEELEGNRAKISYLSKISVWQDVARRLAHEIKNPLQPIQLAVQELHRRYGGADQEYRKVLDRSLEIVQEEVATLRRLTTEFSTFARLPEVQLRPDDLYGLLRDCAQTPAPEEVPKVSVEWRIPDEGEPCVVAIDRMLLRRVIDNLVRNAVEAVRAVRIDGSGQVVVSAATDAGRRRVRIRVADNGPGIPEDARERLFDPYYTTKAEGTGLGLAIVKKVVLDHGGSIEVGTSSMGGAELVVSLPLSLRSASLVPPRPNVGGS